MLRTRTSQDLRWGSKLEPVKKLNASFLEAEKDLVRRSSGKNEVGLEVLEKRDLRTEEEEGLLLVEEEEEGSKVVRRSQRHSGQNPENCSCGCRSQLKEERGGCAGGGSGGGGGCVGSAVVVGFIPGGNVQCALCSCYSK